MKKVFFSLAVLATVALVSCNSKKAETVDSDTVVAEVVEETVAVDTATGDTTVAVEAAEVVEAPAADSAK